MPAVASGFAAARNTAPLKRRKTPSSSRPLERVVRLEISASDVHRVSWVVSNRTGKKTPGGAGTHMGHTGARGQTDHTDEPHSHNHPPKPKDTNPHENRDRLNGRKNSRKPGVDRSPRPTQNRQPPANPTLPPPAPRAPPRACSKAYR